MRAVHLLRLEHGLEAIRRVRTALTQAGIREQLGGHLGRQLAVLAVLEAVARQVVAGRQVSTLLGLLLD